MDNTYAFVVRNFKSIAICVSFAIGLYIQHQANVSKIVLLENEVDNLNNRLDGQYTKLDAIKLDKTVFEATIKQFSDMSNDIREIRSSLESMMQQKDSYKKQQ